MRLIFLFAKSFIYFFKYQCYFLQIGPLGSYLPMETLFALFVAALEVFNCLLHYQPSFFYKEFLEKLRKRVICVRPDIADKWMLHHDNASCHTALYITECLTSKSIRVVPSPYSPYNFFLSPKLKNVLKGRHFRTLENIQKSVTDILMTITIEDFQRCYQKWETRLHRCLAAQGNYLENNNIDV